MSRSLPLTPGTALRPALVREIRSLASSSLLYPFGLTEATNACLLRALSVGVVPRRVMPTPVVLVHGYGGNRSGWVHLQARLAAAGYLDVHAVSCNPLTAHIPTIAARLVRECDSVARLTDATHVHVIGHSLGGVVLRYAATRDGLGERLATGVSIASPHGGTAIARLGWGPVAADLRPGSALLDDLASRPLPPTAQWICYWSDGDWVVTPDSARLPGTPPAVTNIAVPEEGHLSVLQSPALLNDVVARLLAADGETGGSWPELPSPTRRPAAAGVALAA